MFIKEDYIFIGKILKTHGIHGELIVEIEKNILRHKISEMESVFIEYEGLLVPFFILEIEQYSNSSMIIRLKDMESIEQAKEFISCSIYIPEVEIKKSISQQAKNKISFVGYKVIDKKLGDIGELEEYIAYNKNPLYKIRKSKEVYFIPDNPQFIDKIDNKRKLIMVSIPEELFNL